MASRFIPLLVFTGSAAIVLLVLPAVTAQESDGISATYNRTPALNSFNLHPRSKVKKYHRILIAHAVLGTIAWALIAPLGAVLLRINIRGIELLQLHITCQLLVYFMYAGSTGLGLYLRYQLDSPHRSRSTIWAYPHAAIGMLVFIFMAIQPLLGWIHHIIFKHRFNALKEEENDKDDDDPSTRRLTPHKKPGRTAVTHGHLWLGRLLILVAIANAGLGVHVTGDGGGNLQSAHTSRVALVAYCVVAGCIALPATFVLFSWERRRAAGIRRAAKLDEDVDVRPLTSPPGADAEAELGPDRASSVHEESELEKGADLQDGRDLSGSITSLIFEDVSRQSLEVGKKSLALVGGVTVPSRASTLSTSVADGGPHVLEASRKYSVVSVGRSGGILP